MRSTEDFELPNSDKLEFVRRLEQMGAVTGTTLAEVSGLLEAKGDSFIALFGQLPFRLDGGSEWFDVNGWRAGVTVQIRFQPAMGALLPTGNFQLWEPESESDAPPASLVEFTQVVAFVRLWNKRARLHKLYKKYVTPRGVRNEVIGKVENWMYLPEAQMSMPARRHANLTAVAFENEVASRVLAEFLRAIKTFLRAYSLAYLENIAFDDKIYGYFVMLVPDRLVQAGNLLPIAAGLMKAGRSDPVARPTALKIGSLLGNHLATNDRVVRQLMAMNELVRRGEPELAVVGCTSTVEFFVNEAFPGLKKAGSTYVPSLGQCWNHPLLEPFGKKWQVWLKDLAQLRKPFVHGAPPQRYASPNRVYVVDADGARELLFQALEFYRMVNMHLGRQQVALDELSAPVDD